MFRKNTALRRKLSVALGEPVKEKDFSNAGKRLFKYLEKNREYSRQQIFEFLIKKNSREISVLLRTIEDFICLDPAAEEEQQNADAIGTHQHVA